MSRFVYILFFVLLVHILCIQQINNLYIRFILSGSNNIKKITQLFVTSTKNNKIKIKQYFKNIKHGVHIMFILTIYIF